MTYTHDPDWYSKWLAIILAGLHAQTLEAIQNGWDLKAKSAAKWLARVSKHGMVTKRLYLNALPYAVKVCGICGKTALYRHGREGRCREHRMIPSRGDAFVKRCFKEGSEDRARIAREVDYVLLNHQNLHSVKRDRGRR